MHLKSITMKGFKSFPERTVLEFSPGVSVIVGPNGSGKSNIADAIVWALGEQSPGSIRGQSMQDVIFGGGPGVASRNASEVEIVIDNSDGGLGSDFAELSIMRRLDRSGEGEYRINGARCRLVDVLEVLSDSGLGKEMHSVVSQGKVDSIVTSKPRDRRLLVEEAAGLGKHRKRRRRAQMKLDRTRDNLDRVLDVEREARTRLKPLKRQAEAAETHERLEHQSCELRAELAADRMLRATTELSGASTVADQARSKQAELELELTQVSQRREQVEQSIAERTAARESLSSQFFTARAARQGIELRAENVLSTIGRLERELAARETELQQLELDFNPVELDEARATELETELGIIEQQGKDLVEGQLEILRAELAATEQRLTELQAALQQAQARAAEAESARNDANDLRAEARTTIEQTKAATAGINAELAAVNRFLAGAGSIGSGQALAERIVVEAGYENALAAVLGSRLRAVVAENQTVAGSLLDGFGDEGGSSFVAGAAGTAGDTRSIGASDAPTGERLADRVKPDADIAALVNALLADVDVVDRIENLPTGYRGTAVTKAGRVWFGQTGELRQAPRGGEERVLEARNRRTDVIARLEGALSKEKQAEASLATADESIAAATTSLEVALEATRLATRARDEAAHGIELKKLKIERVEAEDNVVGPAALRRAEIEAELRALRQQSEQAAKEQDRVERRRADATDRVEVCRSVLPAAQELRSLLGSATAAVAETVERMSARLETDKQAAEGVAEELRACARREAELQALLRSGAEQVTQAAVRAQQARDVAAEAETELSSLAERLGRELSAATEPLETGQRDEIEQKVERLARRRELLGPVNPLAKDEYEAAVAHVEELEAQRTDLESAIKELEKLIKEIDRTIQTAFEETFESTARHFSEVIERLFPGGKGSLQLVHEERPPEPGLIVPQDEADAEAQSDAAEAAAELEEDPQADDREPGVEIVVTLPGSKSRKLTLLSGGEKSLVALAFVFATFLTRPCPFYVLDEAEAALDDINIDRLLTLLREYSDRAQFIVITHQKRTMDAATCLYGVSMAGDGVSKVITRRLAAAGDAPSETLQPQLEEQAAVA